MKKSIHGIEFNVEEVDPLDFLKVMLSPDSESPDIDRETFQAIVDKRNTEAAKENDSL